jgi:prepilin-type N-terminal cleavage/methylation domain-containing protein
MQSIVRGRSADDGFSLIELVVALAVVGVLVAVVVPSFSGLRAAVRQGATTADLGNDRTALVGYATDNAGTVPSSTAFNPGPNGSNLVGYGWQQSPESTSYRYFTNTDRTAWCLEMTNVTGVVFRISGNTATQQAATCAALGVANY